MRARTVAGYLVGSRRAIVEIAASRWAWAVGLLFVVTAGVAREYDGEDLVREPWHALRPVVASLVSGTLLFWLLDTATRKEAQGRPSLWVSYRAFMGLFWLTAPMAWLYTVPYERWLSPAGAVEANLWTLAAVSVWRVALMVRVACVVYGFGWVSALFVVLAFGDVVAVAAVSLMPRPILDVMGGLRLSERDRLVSTATFFVQFWGIVTAPVWLIGAWIAIARHRGRWAAMGTDGRVPRGALVAAGAALVASAPLLMMGQPEQMRRADAERMLRSGRIGEAFAMMSRYERGDFPPFWDPPPRMGYGEDEPSVEAIAAELTEGWPGGWVGPLFLEKVRTRLERRWWLLAPAEDLAEKIERLREIGRDRGSDLQITAGEIALVRLMLARSETLTERERWAMEELVAAFDAEAGAGSGPDGVPEAGPGERTGP